MFFFEICEVDIGVKGKNSIPLLTSLLWRRQSFCDPHPGLKSHEEAGNYDSGDFINDQDMQMSRQNLLQKHVFSVNNKIYKQSLGKAIVDIGYSILVHFRELL